MSLVCKSVAQHVPIGTVVRLCAGNSVGTFQDDAGVVIGAEQQQHGLGWSMVYAVRLDRSCQIRSVVAEQLVSCCSAFELSCSIILWFHSALFVPHSAKTHTWSWSEFANIPKHRRSSFNYEYVVDYGQSSTAYQPESVH